MSRLHFGEVPHQMLLMALVIVAIPATTILSSFIPPSHAQ
jgi:hypothetical protein